MKKKTVANLVMVALILVIVASGVLGVGYIQGWFDKDDGTQGVLSNIVGIVNLEREGVSYPATESTILRTNDKLVCESGATGVIRVGEDSIVIGEKAVLTVTDPSTTAFEAEIASGEVFANTENPATFCFNGKSITVCQATAHISVRSGAQTVSVFRGTVAEAGAGQTLNYVGQECTVGTLSIQSLNDFTIARIRSFGDTVSLCFTEKDLDKLVADRQAAMQELIDNQTTPTTPATESTDPTTVPGVTQEQGAAVPSDSTDASAPSGAEEADTPEVTPPPATTIPPETTAPPATTVPSSGGTCTIAIYCNTILNNMDDLEPGKAEFVPEDGEILYPVTVSFKSGETVFDVLKRVCHITGIQLEYSWTPLYNSYYIEGINNLYEFNCGNESGWMYKVNGWFPNYGCSSYSLKDGDVIVWAYTCKGLGTDVGAPEWDG